MSSLEVVVTIVGLIPLYLDLIRRLISGRKIHFSLLRFQEKMADSGWGIRILHPDKPVEKCSVYYNGVKLRWWDNPEPYFERFIEQMGGGNVLIPKGSEKDEAIVIVKDGKRTLRKSRFKDIPIVHA